jgi:hypothetical protein
MKYPLGIITSVLLGSLSDANAASVTLAWDAESGVAGYRLHYGTSSGSYTQTSEARLPTKPRAAGNKSISRVR